MLGNTIFRCSILYPNIDRKAVMQAPNHFSTAVLTPFPEFCLPSVTLEAKGGNPEAHGDAMFSAILLIPKAVK